MSPNTASGSMAKRLLSSGIFLGILLLILQVAISSAAPIEDTKLEDADYWIQRRVAFIRNTTFNLDGRQMAHFGGPQYSRRQAYLPFWFDFKLFKTVYNKTYPTPAEELKRHVTFLKTCIRTLKNRILDPKNQQELDFFIDKDAAKFWTESIPYKLGGATVADYSNEIVASIQFEDDEDDTYYSEADLVTGIRQNIEWAGAIVQREVMKLDERGQIERYFELMDYIDEVYSLSGFAGAWKEYEKAASSDLTSPYYMNGVKNVEENEVKVE